MTVSGTDRARALIQIEALLSRNLSLEWRSFGPDVANHLLQGVLQAALEIG
jgi:hypothetical protein